jgi:hypothetical protein
MPVDTAFCSLAGILAGGGNSRAVAQTYENPLNIRLPTA